MKKLFLSLMILSSILSCTKEPFQKEWAVHKSLTGSYSIYESFNLSSDLVLKEILSVHYTSEGYSSSDFGSLNISNATVYTFNETSKMLAVVPLSNGKIFSVIDIEGTNLRVYSMIAWQDIIDDEVINGTTRIIEGSSGYFMVSGEVIVNYTFLDGEVIDVENGDDIEPIFESFGDCFGESMGTLFDWNTNWDSSITCTFMPIPCAAGAALYCMFNVEMGELNPYTY